MAESKSGGVESKATKKKTTAKKTTKKTKKTTAKKTTKKTTAKKDGAAASPPAVAKKDLIAAAATRLEKIYAKIGKLKKDKIHPSIVAAKDNAASLYLEVGALMWRMNDEKAYLQVERGDGHFCVSMKEYAGHVLGIAERKMFQFMQIHRELVAEMKVESEALLRIGWSKAGLIAGIAHDSQEEAKKLLKAAEELPYKELTKEVKEVRRKLKGEAGPSPGDDVSRSEDVMTTVKYRISEITKENVVDAAYKAVCAVAGEALPEGEFLEYVCQEFLNGHPETETESFKQAVARLSTYYDVQITWKASGEADAKSAEKKGAKSGGKKEAATKPKDVPKKKNKTGPKGDHAEGELGGQSDDFFDNLQ